MVQDLHTKISRFTASSDTITETLSATIRIGINQSKISSFTLVTLSTSYMTFTMAVTLTNKIYKNDVSSISTLHQLLMTNLNIVLLQFLPMNMDKVCIGDSLCSTWQALSIVTVRVTKEDLSSTSCVKQVQMGHLH